MFNAEFSKCRLRILEEMKWKVMMTFIEDTVHKSKCSLTVAMKLLSAGKDSWDLSFLIKN